MGIEEIFMRSMFPWISIWIINFKWPFKKFHLVVFYKNEKYFYGFFVEAKPKLELEILHNFEYEQSSVNPKHKWWASHQA